MKGKRYGKPAAAALAAFAVCLLVCLALFGRVTEKETAARRSETAYLAANKILTMEKTFEEYEQIPQVWSGVVLAHGGEVDDFEEISQQLYEKNPTINAIQLSPDGVVTYSYPRNNDIIGHDLFASEKDHAEAEEARDSGEFVITGPIDLVQGGRGVIIRYPITLDGEFWGFSTIVLNAPEIFEDVGLEDLTGEGYLWRLIREDSEAAQAAGGSGSTEADGGAAAQAAGGEAVQIAGSDEAPTDPVACSTVIGRRTWTLEIAPASGWTDTASQTWRRVIAVLISALAAAGAFLIMMLIRRNKELENMRSDMTIQIRALAASEKANRMQTRALEVSKKANEMQAEALAASKRANEAQLEALETARRENVRQAAKLEASEAANRAKTEFISRISHDIRTPIGAIKNLTEFALEDLDDKEKLKEDLEKIETSNKFLLSLINDVLDISRVDSGKIELTPEPYPYAEYAANIRNILGPMCAEKDIHYEMSEEGGAAGVIVADKVRINQIVLNLLSNAVKYTPAGGKVRYISRSRDLPDGKVRYAFSIEDTGIGMSEEFQQTMFEEFSQEYSNPLRQQGTTGTGLGLSIVKRMIDLMGGTIEVKSAVGKGTAVSVEIDFPDALRDERYKEQLESAVQADGTKAHFAGHILVVEDNVINQAIALRIFEECGLSADLAVDGRDGLGKFTSMPPGTYDAIFMDIQMPNMNGYEATKAIRALAGEEARTIPIIAMTADAFEEALRKAEEAGMNDFVTKPLSVDYIQQVLIKYGLRDG